MDPQRTWENILHDMCILNGSITTDTDLGAVRNTLVCNLEALTSWVERGGYIPTNLTQEAIADACLAAKEAL